ncbi:hypothetical protein B0H65DRAFT_473446 [Neurospora tetraspora]|uniref:Uncharacterized protein n=1 Tax=Neurospora tetraspora TaxID=94610 RepID=A0AAE0JBS5_9PEZI|nr:hypothetical protein B0H65DRAFT_473446 [Neurospora tetraspora]
MVSWREMRRTDRVASGILPLLSPASMPWLLDAVATVALAAAGGRACGAVSAVFFFPPSFWAVTR